MTADKVVDASALAALVFNEPSQSAVEQRLRGAALYAPLWLDVEMASVCLKKIREQPVNRAALMSSYFKFTQFAIRKLPVALSEAMEVAEKFDLSLYDANYLWLARSLGIELVTLDRELLDAIAKG